MLLYKLVNFKNSIVFSLFSKLHISLIDLGRFTLVLSVSKFSHSFNMWYMLRILSHCSQVGGGALSNRCL